MIYLGTTQSQWGCHINAYFIIAHRKKISWLFPWRLQVNIIFIFNGFSIWIPRQLYIMSNYYHKSPVFQEFVILSYFLNTTSSHDIMLISKKYLAVIVILPVIMLPPVIVVPQSHCHPKPYLSPPIISATTSQSLTTSHFILIHYFLCM